MRTNAYVAVLASFLAVLLAFATTSALAETMTKPTMEPSGTTGQYRDKAASQAETEFSGEAKTGAFQKEKEKAPEARIPGQQQTAQRIEGGEAIVARIDRPQNCLRVRSGPGASYDEIGCAAKGDRLVLTGVFSEDGRWAQLDNNSWVFFRQLRTEVRPPLAMASGESFDQPAAAAGKKKKFRRGHKRFHGYSYGCGGFYGYPYGGYSYYPYGGYYTYPSYYYGGSHFGAFRGFPSGFTGGLFGSF